MFIRKIIKACDSQKKFMLYVVYVMVGSTVVVTISIVFEFLKIYFILSK